MKYIVPQFRMLRLVGMMVNSSEPDFTEEKAKVVTYSNGDDTYLNYLVPTKRHPVARYYVWKKELVLDMDLFLLLENYFGENGMTYVIDWFNNEFEQDAETVSF